MEKKNVVFLTVLAVATLLTAVVGTTFAYFTATVTNTNTPTATQVTTASDLGITYSDGDEIGMTNIVPGQYTDQKTITVTNNSTTTPMHYQITWENVVNGFTKGATETTDDLVYSLSSDGTNKIGTTGYAPAATTNNYVTTTLGAMAGTKAYSVAGGKATIDAGSTEITVAAVPETGVDAILVPDTEIAAGATHTYVLRVYYLETGVVQNENLSKKGTTVAAHCENASNETVSAADQTSCEETEGNHWVAATVTGAHTVSFSGKLKASILASNGIRAN